MTMTREQQIKELEKSATMDIKDPNNYPNTYDDCKGQRDYDIGVVDTAKKAIKVIKELQRENTYLKIDINNSRIEHGMNVKYTII